MDINSLLSTMLSSGSVNGISQLTGSSSQDVSNVLASALPSLLSGAGMQATAENSGFEQAIASHAKDDTSNLGSFMSGVDMKDGAKILNHLLGSNTAATTNAVAKRAGVSNKSTASILSAAAPLLMSLLGQQTQQSHSSGLSTANLIGSLLTGSLNSGNQSLLGALLGGGQTHQYQQPQQTSLLGALLGGGQTQQVQQPQQASLLSALLGGGQTTQQSSGLDLTSLALNALTGGSAATTQPTTVTNTSAKKKKTSSATTTTAKKKTASTKPATTTTTTAKKKKTGTTTTAQQGVNLSDGVDANDVLGILSSLLK